MNEERITAYLLQELTEEEAGRFEEQCFASEEWPNELESAEHDLIDDYLNKKLSQARRERFEKNYLTTDVRKARVLTAQSLHKVLPARHKAHPQPKKATFWDKLQAFRRSPIPQTAMVIFLVAVSAALLVPYLMTGRRPPQTFQPLELAISSADRATGSQAAKVTLPLHADALQIHLKLPPQSTYASSYRVQWVNTSADLGDLQIASKDTQSVVIIIPAAKLSPGQYALQLFRINEDGTEQRVSGSYYFTAEEEPGRTR